MLLEMPFGSNHPPLLFVATTTEGLDVNRFAVQGIEFGLVVERVDMTGAAVHEEKDHMLGLGRKMRLLRLKRALPNRLPICRNQLILEESILFEEPREGQRSKSASHGVKKVTPCATAEGIAWFFSSHNPISSVPVSISRILINVDEFVQVQRHQTKPIEHGFVVQLTDFGHGIHHRQAIRKLSR